MEKTLYNTTLITTIIETSAENDLHANPIGESDSEPTQTTLYIVAPDGRRVTFNLISKRWISKLRADENCL